MSAHLITIRRVLRVLGLLGNGAHNHTRLREDLNLDGAAQTDLHYELEDEYRITIRGQEFDKFSTIGDIVTYLTNHNIPAPHEPI